MSNPQTASQINAPQVGETRLDQITRFNTQKNEALERAHRRIAELESLLSETRNELQHIAADLNSMDAHLPAGVVQQVTERITAALQNK